MARDDDDDDDDDRPRRRRKRRDDDDDDDYDDRPRRRRREGGNNSGGAGKVVLIILAVGFGLFLVCGVGGYMLFMPAYRKVQEAKLRVEEMNNLKQIAMGMHNYTDRTGRPPRADGDVSWRVHLLPYVEQEALFRQFDVNSAWNQGPNKAAGETFIRVYQSPLDEPPTSQTHWRVFVGDGTAFDPKLWRGGGLNFILDGTSNTIMAIDTAETVPWAAPKEVVVLPGGQFPAFGHPKRGQVMVATWDGAVKSVEKSKLDAATIRILASAAGGEAVPLDW